MLTRYDKYYYYSEFINSKKEIIMYIQYKIIIIKGHICVYDTVADMHMERLNLPRPHTPTQEMASIKEVNVMSPVVLSHMSNVLLCVCV